VGDPILVVLVAVLTFWLVGRALRPVEALRARAAVITAADQRARLPVVATGDEVERLARTLNEMLSRLEVSAQAQRRFVADASHELRSPVATIRTLHEVAAAHADVADWDAVSVDVLSETARLERLVDDLLLLARPSRPPGRTVELVDLGALVREEVARARIVPVRADPAPGVVVVGHRDSLARALRNLLDNAERHTRSVVDVEVAALGGRALLTVRDDGSGIDSEDRERVFERFVRLDEARTRDGGGSGLGLAITRYVAEAHGGQVRVEPSEVGASFVLDLPLRSSAGGHP
jgi:signal transduction histidine kinase